MLNGIDTQILVALQTNDYLYPKDIQELLKAGAKVNITDHNGDTPLIHAVRKCVAKKTTPETIAILLQAGAEVTAVNSKGRNALMELCAEYVKPGIYDPNITRKTMELLIDAEIDVNAEDYEHRTALLLLESRSTLDKELVIAGATYPYNWLRAQSYGAKKYIIVAEKIYKAVGMIKNYLPKFIAMRVIAPFIGDDIALSPVEAAEDRNDMLRANMAYAAAWLGAGAGYDRYTVDRLWKGQEPDLVDAVLETQPSIARQFRNMSLDDTHQKPPRKNVQDETNVEGTKLSQDDIHEAVQKYHEPTKKLCIIL
jgi:ankyrin repeat protein